MSVSQATKPPTPVIRVFSGLAKAVLLRTMNYVSMRVSFVHSLVGWLRAIIPFETRRLATEGCELDNDADLPFDSD